MYIIGKSCFFKTFSETIIMLFKLLFRITSFLCFRLLPVICIYFLCPCTVSLIDLVVVAPVH